MYRNPNLRGTRGRDAAPARAFDAVGSSALAFLSSQLEQIDTDLVEPLQAVTHPRHMPMNLVNGFPEFISAFASNYAATGGNQYGLQGTSNTDIPMFQADVQKGVWKVFNWVGGIFISWLDLQRMKEAADNGQTPPFSLQEIYDNACRAAWLKALDKVSYLGWLGQPGLINNTNAPETAVPTGASSSTTWASKTAEEILYDVNYLINAVMANSGYDGERAMPNSMLVPYPQFARLTRPMTLAGAGSIKEYVEKYCIAAHNGEKFTIDFLPNDWISGQGAGSPATDRAVVYRKDKNCLYLSATDGIKQMMTMPTTRGGGGYETLYVGVTSQVIFKRTTTMIYGDGI